MTNVIKLLNSSFSVLMMQKASLCFGKFLCRVHASLSFTNVSRAILTGEFNCVKGDKKEMKMS